MSFKSDPHPVYSFGPFRVDFENCEIQKHGIRLHFQNQPMHILRFLIERPGQLISRQELQEELWPGLSPLERDDSLNSSVKKLREALSDDPGKPLYIETIPRRGYRFVAPVQVENPEAVSAAKKEDHLTLPERPGQPFGPEQNPESIERPWWSRHRISATLGVLALVVGVALLFVTRFMKRAAADTQIHSIVVLPFENLSEDAGQDYFAEGLTDAVTTDLAQLGSIKVISRTSANLYKKSHKSVTKIREELGVDALVEGTVAHSGSKVRVNAQLISAGDDRHLWAQSFERDEGDIVGLQDDLAQSVAARIRAAITPEQQVRLSEAHPVNVQAYEAYLTGMHDLNVHRTNDELKKSLEEFDQAVALDPTLAKAFAGEAQAYNLLGDYDAIEGKEAGPRAEAAARRALELDSSLASAHAALAFSLWKYKWNWNEAESEFRKALALNPNNAHSHHIFGVFLACRGNFRGADEQIRKAEELDPLSMIIRTNKGWIQYFQHNYAGAEATYEEVLKLDPSFLPARQKLWIAYALDGKTQRAGDELENLMRLFGHQNLVSRVEKVSPSARYQTAVKAYVESGVLTPYERARYQALLGRRRDAIEALNEAERQQSAWMVYLGIEPAFDGIRATPGFESLVRDAHIPEEAAISSREN
jgi:TolB-like protein/DNA-binding winged helix-turn-helix (wHTH) protein